MTDGGASGDSPAGRDPHEAFAASLVGKRIGERYVVERILGMGGMGLVFVARYADLDQDVAIKIMFPEHAANPVLAARFTREAKLAAKVKSPHLVRVSDVGRIDGGVPYLVMELLSGRDLDRELAERGPLPVGEAVDYVLQALAGLAELHALGIVHRDLKPANLFLTDVRGARTVKILDFGISKEGSGAGGALTVTDAIIGTPSYMSPEQIKTPKEIDTRSDLWSVGIILYELVTGRQPFDTEGNGFGELFGLILFSEPVPPTRRRDGLPDAFEQVIMRCLRRDRGERYANVGELAEALLPFAPATSAHRVAAIKASIGGVAGPIAAQPSSDPSLVAAVVRRASDPELQVAFAPSGEHAATSRAAILGETTAGPPREPLASARSLATSTRSVSSRGESPRRRRVAWIGALVALALASGIWALVIGLRGMPGRATTGADPPGLSSPSATVSARTAASSSAWEVSTVIVAPPTVSARSSGSSRPAAPRARPAASAGAPPARSAGALPAASAGAPPGPAGALPGGLILDRK